MLITLGVLLVTSLLLVAAFLAAEGDIGLSHHNTNFKQAYYAAVAGIQEYADQLQLNPDYWASCPKLTNVSIGSKSAPETYTVEALPAEHPTTGTAASHCEEANPFASMIERAGSATGGSFRVEAKGKAGASTRKVVATFKQGGFLNYVYFTDYEDESPELDKAEPSACAGEYYDYRSEKNLKCGEIEFTGGDSVYGPMFTDDGADICGKVVFGRKGHNPPDTVEMGEGAHAASGCNDEAEYFDKAREELKKNEPEETKEKLEPPLSDSSLTTYVLKEPGNDYEFDGLTHIVLKGETLEVTNEGTTKTIKWPENGLIYVKSSSKSCSFVFGENYEKQDLDTTTEEDDEEGCGTVYVEGSYAKPLTIAAENDVVIHGNIWPSAISKVGEAPPTSDTATLGLIANEYVRIYHPIEEKCETVTKKVSTGGTGGGHGGGNKPKEETISETVCEQTNKNGPGKLIEPWIYAAILTTKGSFIVDNYDKGSGSELKYLNVYGAIAQNYRGIVGTGSSNGSATTGYLKDYIYDERLAVDEPPYFLQPVNAEWKVIRETTTTEG